MNLFGKKLFRKFKSTDVYEKEMDELFQSYERYTALEKSDLLKEYLALRKEVKSAEFKENKKILINRKFKDTKEYDDWKKFNKLERNRGLHAYMELASSPQLKEFLAFKSTPEYELIGNKLALAKSEKLRQFRAYEKSADYKTYTRFHDSYIFKEYQRLKAVVTAPEFIKFKNFWSNPQRWKTTDAYKQEEKFNQLSDHADIVFYKKTDPELFRFWKTWKHTFGDEFRGVSLDRSKWDFGYYFSDPSLIRDYSLAEQKQANNNGKNVSVANGALTIKTLAEETTARAWDATTGFITKKFNYTSDIINAGETYRFTKGMVQVKLRTGGGRITHVCSLVGEKQTPQINIFHADGNRISVGYASHETRQTEMIKGISPSNYYIYQLEWNDNELIWNINNVEVFRSSGNIPNTPLFPLFASLVDAHQDDAGVLDVDWIRIYQKK